MPFVAVAVAPVAVTPKKFIAAPVKLACSLQSFHVTVTTYALPVSTIATVVARPKNKLPRIMPAKFAAVVRPKVVVLKEFEVKLTDLTTVKS